MSDLVDDDKEISMTPPELAYERSVSFVEREVKGFGKSTQLEFFNMLSDWAEARRDMLKEGAVQA